MRCKRQNSVKLALRPFGFNRISSPGLGGPDREALAFESFKKGSCVGCAHRENDELYFCQPLFGCIARAPHKGYVLFKINTADVFRQTLPALLSAPMKMLCCRERFGKFGPLRRDKGASR